MLLACDEIEVYFGTQNLASQTAEGREVLCEVGSGLDACMQKNTNKAFTTASHKHYQPLRFVR